jgi:hypothetical protein
MSLPAALLINVTQLRVAAPLTCTVQAPQQPHATPVLGPGELQQVAEVPQQRHLRIAIERTLNAIDLALNHGLTSL